MKQRDVHSGMQILCRGKPARVESMMLNSAFVIFEDETVDRVTYKEIEPCTNTENITAQNIQAKAGA